METSSENRSALDPAHPPLVSVVMPTHNRAALLTRAIRSVQHQTYPHLEIIIVDDASADNTREVIESLHDSRIRYIRHETNRGGSAARNTGIRAATGQYIAFLDDDDAWEPDKTAEQLAILAQYDAVFCTSDEPGSGLPEHDNKAEVTLEDLRRGQFTAGGTGVLMAKADVIKNTMFDESLPRYQDWDVFIRIAEKHTIGYLNKRLVRYNEGTHHRISNKILNMPAVGLENQLRMLQKHRDFFGHKWFKRHMCAAMLYGIRHRPDKLEHLWYMVQRFGLLGVSRILVQRTAEILMEKLRAYMRPLEVEK